MTCFDDIIAVKDNVGSVVPTSGIYLNAIGIGLEELNKINNSDYASGELFFDAKVEFAVTQLVNELHGRLSSKFKTNSILEGANLGYYKDNKKITSGYADALSGIEIDLCNTSSYLDLFVSSISLFTDFTGDIDVQVIDLLQSKVLETITIECTAGEISTKEINKTYKSSRNKLNIVFAYDTTTIQSYESLIRKGYCFDCTPKAVSCNQFVEARGCYILDSDSMIKSNVKTLPNTAGMMLNYSLQCNHADWLCTNANLMALPILYRTGIDIAEHALVMSSRNNGKVREDHEKWKERLSLYNAKYDYHMDSLMKNIKLPQDKHCFECNPSSKHAIVLP